jgi:hypothetical protein
MTGFSRFTQGSVLRRTLAVVLVLASASVSFAQDRSAPPDFMRYPPISADRIYAAGEGSHVNLNLSQMQADTAAMEALAFEVTRHAQWLAAVMTHSDADAPPPFQLPPPPSSANATLQGVTTEQMATARAGRQTVVYALKSVSVDAAIELAATFVGDRPFDPEWARGLLMVLAERRAERAWARQQVEGEGRAVFDIVTPSTPTRVFAAGHGYARVAASARALAQAEATVALQENLLDLMRATVARIVYGADEPPEYPEETIDEVARVAEPALGAIGGVQTERAHDRQVDGSFEVSMLVSTSPDFLIDPIVSAFDEVGFSVDRARVVQQMAGELLARTEYYFETLRRLFGAP